MADEQLQQDGEIKLTKEFIEKAYEAFAKGKVTIKDFRGLDDAQMEAIYSLGYNFYQTGRIADARTVFEGLTILDQLNAKYWIGLAATFQEEDNWDRAALCYQTALLMDETDPRPPFHLAEFFARKGMREQVEACVDLLKKLAKTEGTDYLPRAERLLAGMGGGNQ